MNNLTPRQRGLLIQARSKLFDFMHMPLSASVVLFDLASFKSTETCMWNITSLLVADKLNETYYSDTAYLCHYWAEEWHGWDAHVMPYQKHLMHDLRRISEEMYKDLREIKYGKSLTAH